MNRARVSAMTRQLSAIGLTLALSSALFAACGGDTEPGSLSGGGEAGQSNEGGDASSSGGSASTGGGRPTGGAAPTGGRAPSGGSASEAGSGGEPQLGEECTLPPESGSCDAYIPSYYHDAATGLCRPFVYGGCGGNANRYDTLEACQSACSGGEPNYDECEVASDCIVTSPGCCAACEPVSARDFIAIHRDREDDFKGNCDVACGPCPDPGAGAVPVAGNFFAACIDRECRLMDLRGSEAAKCEADDDCGLRDGAQCCEGCGGQPVSISDESVLQSLLECPADLPCPTCAPRFDPTYRARCRDEQCVVEVEQ
jgi:hypothetical protein